MFVAAMLEAFPEYADRVLTDVSAVLPRKAGEARLARVSKNGIAALQFSLADPSPAPEVPSAEMAAAGAIGGPAKQSRRAPTAARPFTEAASMNATPSARPQHGTCKALRRVIEQARRSGSVTKHALGILPVLAEAEAAINGVAVDEVHSYELAAWDSLMEVVAAGSVISAVGDATWSVDALPLGGGHVRTQHGWLPVPAPATALILKGYPWRPLRLLQEHNLCWSMRAITERPLASGTNVNDLSDYRPGLQAAAERNVVYPFVEAGINKRQIRTMARQQGWTAPTCRRSPALQPYRNGNSISCPGPRLRRKGGSRLKEMLGGNSIVRVRVRAGGVHVKLADWPDPGILS